MYTEPKSFTEQVKAFAQRLKSHKKALLLVRVELTLFMAREVGFGDEPLAVGWILLSRMPLRHPIFESLTSEQRRMIANAAHLVPFSSRFAWLTTLARYHKDISPDERAFNIPDANFDQHMIINCSRDQHYTSRFEAYRQILIGRLPFYRRVQHYPKAQRAYQISIRLDGKLAQGAVTFTEDHIKHAQSIDSNWLTTPRPRAPFEIRLSELLPTAVWLDSREEALGKRPHWVNDFKRLNFRRIRPGKKQRILKTEDDPVLSIGGVFNLVGMVASGKTTLAKLIIAHVLRSDVDLRITFVVGDTHTAIQMAHEVNQWFYDDPSGPACIAVPLLGTTQRELHLSRLIGSREYQKSLEDNRPHWGERWLSTTCPLQALIQWETRSTIHVPAGLEPCTHLKGIPSDTSMDTGTDQEGKKKKTPRAHLCPFHGMCPSKQIYRDMPQAKLWIATPGVLSSGSLPTALDPRSGTMGDLVYEQSDLVIIDEVETVMAWLDNTFAQAVHLTKGGSGVFDKLDLRIAEYMMSNRTLDTEPRRWMSTLRDSLKIISSILSAMNNQAQKDLLRRWLKRGYFTANSLAYQLSRRLAGLKEWDFDGISQTERLENEAQIDAIFVHFKALLNDARDLLRLPSVGLVSEATAQLVPILQAINSIADDGTDEAIQAACRQWIERLVPDIQIRLDILKQQLETSSNKIDQSYLADSFDHTLETLVVRLQFMLSVAVLDRHIQIVMHEWHHKPDEIEAAKPFGRIPHGMENILPLPLIGRQFGLYTVPAERAGQTNPENRNLLSMFAYTNIGRSYLLDFHTLRRDLEDQCGPNVLMMSGTSYLPRSTAFHVPIGPHGILYPAPEMSEVLTQSRFLFHACYDEKDRAIRVSGGGRDKRKPLQAMVKSLLRYGGLPGGFVGEVLTDLSRKAITTPDLWRDRGRILLLTNSYDQARLVAQKLREGWREKADSIYHLRRGHPGDDDHLEGYFGSKPLARMDIEQFADCGGHILVAPLEAIGRGFNILNQDQKAAFGAVLFLTRPMWVPGDLSSMAQELNRYALEWATHSDFKAWNEGGSLYERGMLARQLAERLRHTIEWRSSYGRLKDDAELHLYPRDDLASTTAGRVIQAVGRLLRGGVPFDAYFLDAAWAPETAHNGDRQLREGPETSLLKAMINYVCDCAHESEIGAGLYMALADALANIKVVNPS